MRRRLYKFVCACALLVLAGCFAAPAAQPPDDSKLATIVPLPYDLTWEAVKAVIRRNDYRIQAENPNDGILEVAGKNFTLQDADCGRISSIAGSYAATPEPDASAVYNFMVKPHGIEASKVTIDATFASPLKVPLRRTQSIECVSRGVQEERLLKQILAQAKLTHPPEYRRNAGAAREQKPKEPAVTGRPTLLRPDVIRPDLSGPHLK